MTGRYFSRSAGGEEMAVSRLAEVSIRFAIILAEAVRQNARMIGELLDRRGVPFSSSVEMSSVDSWIWCQLHIVAVA